jgi:deferrochelatase/peroxidase EfeB
MLKQSTGASAAGARGMYFTCINANIAEQFEHVQQRWLNDPTFINPSNLEVDPIVGRTRPDSRFTVPGKPTAVLLGEHGVPCERFVKTRGGGYFFLPSKRALSYLAATDR